MPKRLISLADKCEVCVFSVPRILHCAFELAANSSAPPGTKTSQKHNVVRDFMKKYVDKKSKEMNMNFYNEALNLVNSKFEPIEKDNKKNEIINNASAKNFERLQNRRKKIMSFISIFMFIFVISFVSANGLVLNQSSITVNKTINQVPQITIQVTNTEPFQFLNVTIVPNSNIIANTIPTLNSGASANLTLQVIGNNSITTNISIYGIFLNNVGQPFQTYNIGVNQTNPISMNPCDFSIIEGDTIVWQNNLQFDPIVMRDSTGTVISGTSIQPTQTYSRQFNTPESFSYFWSRFSVPITPICTVSVLDSNGYVHDPELDAHLSLSLSVQHLPTSISASANPLQFTVQLGNSQEGTISIQNTGSQIAHDVHLGGEWLSFSDNNFDLNPSQTRGIIFQVSPVVFNTAQTNMTHNKNITITGNFETFNIPLSIFIPLANIGNSSNAINDTNYLINVFCPLFPNSILCSPEPRIEYRYIFNQSEPEINVSITQSRLNDLWIYLFGLGDEMKTGRNSDKIVFDEIHSFNNLTATELASIRAEVKDNSNKTNSVVNFVVFMAILFFLTFSGIVTFTLVWIYKNKNKLSILRRF